MIDLAADDAGHLHSEPGRGTERAGGGASTREAELLAAGGAPAATPTERSAGLSVFLVSLALVEACWVAGIAYVLYVIFR